MFGLMRAKGVVNRKLTRNRKTADAIGRAGASVFGAPPKVETKADMYRKRAQEERENVARWTPAPQNLTRRRPRRGVRRTSRNP